jgi:signal transduction histidine kinase/ActR/RegA family two-component response regulator
VPRRFRLLDRVRAWTGRSVLNRLTAIGMTTSLVLLLALALVAFPLFHRLASSARDLHYANSLERAADQVRFRAMAVVDSLRLLATNSFLVNAFVDSTGRELYLLPTLRDYRPPFGVDYQVTLLDSNFAAFGTTAPERALTIIEARLARAALAEGRTQFAVDDDAGTPRWLIAVPVYYPPASSNEGILLASIDARGLFRPTVLPDEQRACLTVSHEGQILWSTKCVAMQVDGHHTMQAPLFGPDDGKFAVGVTFAETESAAFGVLGWVAAAYVALSLGLLVMVFVATRAMGRPFASKLEELSCNADALAADPHASVTARWDSPDEIGRLTQAFATLVDKWREIQSSLELRVEQRTVELANALAQARESSRAKSEFLAVMSHEIRTPMNGVVGMIQALETTSLSAEQQRQLHVIRTSSDLLLRIIDDLLDFSRVEAGKLALDLAPVRIDELVHDLHAASLPSAQARGIALLVDALPPECAEPVLGDATRLRQVLTNLLHNAIKFTPPHGTVRFRVDVQQAGALRNFVFEVHDSGIGIEASKLARIFDPFEQADRSTTRRFGGTGLGLAIVRRLVDLMGGAVEVQSTPGQGSRFTVRVAFEAAPALPQPAPASPGDEIEAFGQLKVLVAEDNLTNQLVASAMLQSLGVHEVTIANDGREAIDAADRREFDLVLMDVQMPEVDGIEATGAMRRRGLSVPIVAMTANVLTTDRDTYLVAGMNDCLAKPIDREQLRSLIKRLVAESSKPVVAAPSLTHER